MLNTYQQLNDLIPRPDIEIVTVTAVSSNGSMTVTTLGGNAFIATGVAVAVGKKAWCDSKTRTIISEAPNLPVASVVLF